MGKKLVIVESPTKAKTIRKFLGKEYVVESCMGHVRDLPQSAKDIPEKFKKEKWASLGVNVDEDFEPIYCIPNNKTKVVSDLKKKMADADELILATDEDREGESISWHLLEVLKPKVPIKRMVFHEITKDAIQDALGHTRKIDENLVRAQEARRILDRLVGYTISPLVWKKVAYGLSAGRVQSVAVKLVCEREMERLHFKTSLYFSVDAELLKGASAFESKITAYNNKRIATGRDFDGKTGVLLTDKKEEVIALDEKLADKIRTEVQKEKWSVQSVEESPVSRKPAPPFITSTLQQEANRKLGWGARDTMRVAQGLYEEGYITYMRTDSTFLSQQALQAARKTIQSLYGKEYLPDAARDYASKKVKGAQEAHEAIRPAGTEMTRPEDTDLNGDKLKLYELIWKRTVASQMNNALQKQVSVKIQAGAAQFSASGMTIEFPGFLRAYVEGSDDPEAALEEREVQLPQLKKGDELKVKSLKSEPHETKPPARFTEASLVQVMEKEGIGRPSTYAAVIATIIERGYVKKAGNALVPTFTALVVNKLLSQHLPQFVDLGFTSEMERSLDTIADGDLEWTSYLKSLYFGKNGLKAQVDSQEKKIDPDEARSIRLENLKNYEVRVGRFGAYVTKLAKGKEEVSASLPEGQAPADINEELVEQLIEQKQKGVDALTKDPKTGLPVYVLNGRFGPYVQLGDSEGKDAKPKRVSLPTGLLPENVTKEKALFLVQLPLTLGQHTTLKKDVKMGIGRFGPYVVCDGDYRSIPKSEDLFSFTFEKAMVLMSQPKKGRGKAAPLKELGKHPDDGELVQVMNGKYGPYVSWGKVNASLPEGKEPEKLTLAEAVELLAAKAGSGKKGGKKAAPKKKVAESKAADKKVPQKKTVEKKVAEPKAPEKKSPAKIAPTKKAPVKTPAKVASKSKK